MALVLPSAIARNTCSGAVSLSSVHVRRGERAVPKAARERPTRSSTPYVQCVRAIVAIPASSTDRVCCGFSSASGIQLGQASSWVPRPRCPGHLISDAWVPLQLATVQLYYRSRSTTTVVLARSSTAASTRSSNCGRTGGSGYTIQCTLTPRSRVLLDIFEYM